MHYGFASSRFRPVWLIHLQWHSNHQPPSPVWLPVITNNRFGWCTAPSSYTISLNHYQPVSLINCHRPLPCFAAPPMAIIFQVGTTCSFPATLYYLHHAAMSNVQLLPDPMQICWVGNNQVYLFGNCILRPAFSSLLVWSIHNVNYLFNLPSLREYSHRSYDFVLPNGTNHMQWRVIATMYRQLVISLSLAAIIVLTNNFIVQASVHMQLHHLIYTNIQPYTVRWPYHD